MIQLIVVLVVLYLLIQLLVWAWPVFVGLVGLAMLICIVSLSGRQERMIRRRAAEVETARDSALSELDYARRQTEGRMWEEFGRHIRGEVK